jgi:hypothetical protein
MGEYFKQELKDKFGFGIVFGAEEKDLPMIVEPHG